MKAEDKHIEDLISKIMQDVKTESPSAGFTNQVMAQIEANKLSEVIRYKPLISKHIWIIIGCAILGTCLYLFFNTPTNETSLLSQINFNAIINNDVAQTISGFKLPKTVMYTIIGFALMICIQVPLLKHYFNKRLEF